MVKPGPVARRRARHHEHRRPSLVAVASTVYRNRHAIRSGIQHAVSGAQNIYGHAKRMLGKRKSPATVTPVKSKRAKHKHASSEVIFSDNVSIHKLPSMSYGKGSKESENEKIIRALVCPVQVKTSVEIVTNSTPGRAGYMQQQYLAPASSETAALLTAVNTVPTLSDLFTLSAQGWSDTANNMGLTYTSPNTMDSKFTIDYERVKHTVWNRSIIPAHVEFYLYVNKNSQAVDPVNTLFLSAGLETSLQSFSALGGPSFIEGSLKADDVNYKVSSNKYLRSQWSMKECRKFCLPPGEQVMFSTTMGRHVIKENMINQSTPVIAEAAGQAKINYYQGVSHFAVVKYYGALVVDSTIGHMLPAEVNVGWEQSIEYQVTPNFTCRPKVVSINQNSGYSFPGGGQGDTETFLNESIDAIVAKTANSGTIF